MAFTPGDPGEQSAADAAQSRSISEATGIGGGGDGSSGPSLAQFSRLTPGEQAGITGVNIGKNIFGGTNYADQAKAVNAFINRYSQMQGPVNQIEFNEAQGITSKNPYGNLGLGTTFFGIKPSSLDYSNILPTMSGTVYNQKNAAGETVVMSGGKSTGMPASDYLAQYGSPAEQIAANQYSKYINPENVRGQPGFNPAFDAGIAGYGLRPGVEYADYVTQYGPVMEQYRQLSPQELAARTLIGLAPGGILASQVGLKEYGIPGRKGYEDFNPEKPRGAQSMLSNALRAAIPTAKEAINELGVSIFGPSQDLTEGTYNFYGDPSVESSYPNLSSEQQLAGIFGENPKAAGFRSLQDNLRAVIGGENLPDNQNMYGSEMPNLDRSYDLDNLDQVGSLSGQGIGSFDVAADVTGMRDVGGGMYRSDYGKSSLDRALDALGFGSGKKGPSGQIYAPGRKKPNMFKDIVSYFS